MDALGDNPIFIVDDSDVVKPLGKKFEDMGSCNRNSRINRK